MRSFRRMILRYRGAGKWQTDWRSALNPFSTAASSLTVAMSVLAGLARLDGRFRLDVEVRARKRVPALLCVQARVDWE